MTTTPQTTTEMLHAGISVTETIAIRLFHARKRAGITREQLSERSGVPDDVILRIEGAAPSDDDKLLDYLRCLAATYQ